MKNDWISELLKDNFDLVQINNITVKIIPSNRLIEFWTSIDKKSLIRILNKEIHRDNLKGFNITRLKTGSFWDDVWPEMEKELYLKYGV